MQKQKTRRPSVAGLRGTILPHWGSSPMRGHVCGGPNSCRGGRAEEWSGMIDLGPGIPVMGTCSQPRKLHLANVADVNMLRRAFWPQSAYGGASSLAEAQSDLLSLLTYPLSTLSHPETIDSISAITQSCQEATANLQHCCCYQLPLRQAH